MREINQNETKYKPESLFVLSILFNIFQS